MAKYPKISICIPTHNRSSNIKKTILAMLSQSVQDWEMIIGDDASSDNTIDVVGSFDDQRIRYFRHPKNVGIYANWNSLVSRARGNYICIYHDHDLYLPSILESSSQILDQFSNVVFVHTAIVLINKKGQPIRLIIAPIDRITSGKKFQQYSLRNRHFSVCAATTMVRRSAYVRAGDFNICYGLGGDRDMWLRLASYGDVGYIGIPQALILARDKDDTTSKFVWADIAGQKTLFVDWIDVVYDKHKIVRTINKLRFYLRWNIDLLRIMIKASIYDEYSSINEKADSVCTETNWIIRMIIWAIKNSQSFRFLLRALASEHYNTALENRRRKANLYCSEHPEIEQYLDTLTDI